MGTEKWNQPGGMLAFGASAIAIVVTVGAAKEFGAEGASAAASLVATIAVIVGTRYAAENVRELRLASERTVMPLLMVALRKVGEGTEKQLVAEVHNAGAVAVIGLAASYRLVTEFDGPGEWAPLDLNQSFVRPNSHAEADLRCRPWIPMTQHLELRVEFDSVVTGRTAQTWAFQADHWEVRTSGRRI